MPGPDLIPAIGVAVIVVTAAWTGDALVRAAARGTIGINRAVGLRVRALMSSPDAWRRGHEIAAGWTRPAAWVTTGFGIVSVCAIGSAALYLVALAAMLAAVLVGSLGGTVRAVQILRRGR